jgi:hypothetical protein
LTNGLPTGTPTFGSGASGNLSIAVSSSSPIDGTKHLNLVSSAATTVGNMLATQAYAVPLSHQAKLVTFSLDFSAISGTANVNWSGTLTNSFALAAWDVTNSVFIPVIGAFAFVQGSGVGNASGSIQTNSNTASIRFIIYNANATAGAVTLAVKNFYAGKQSFVTGAVMTDWVAYSPVYTGFGAVTPIEAFWKQEGDMMLLKGKVTIGTQTAVNAAISLPNGRVIDPNKNTVVEDVGKYEFNNAAFATYHLLASPSTSVLNFGYSNGTQAGLTILQGSQLGITAGAQMSWSASVPIVGWSSNVQMSSDSSAAVVSFVGTAGSGQVLTASVTDVNLTVASDRSGSWSGSQFKVPVSGDYVVGGALSLGVATTAAVYLNGVIVTNGYFGTSNSSGQQSGGSILVPNCKAGDLLSVRSAVSGTVSTSSINIFRISGNNAVAQVESVRARYSTAGGNTIGTGATTLAFATKTYDSHGAYNTSTGLYTCPTSGEYQAYAYIQPTTAIPGTGSYLNVNLYKNGSSYSELYTVYGNGAVANRVGGTDKVICNAGDTLSISANAGTANTTNGLSYIWFARTGN